MSIMSSKLDIKITNFTVRDLRWPTSLEAIGSDPMNSAGDDAIGYLQYHADSGVIGTGWSFTNGQGNEVLCAAIQAIAPRFVNLTLKEIVSDFSLAYRQITGGVIRFMAPERGVNQLATCAILNAIWDLWAKVEEKPLWRLVAEMTPEQLISVIDFRYLSDVLTPDQALNLLKKQEATKKERLREALNNKAVPAYSTSAGWLAYSDEKVVKLIKEAKTQGFNAFKFKAGIDPESDKKRLKLARDAMGDDGIMMLDVNQIWDVPQAIEYMKHLVEFKPWFIEEPTSPDDVLGHATIKKSLQGTGVGVATGEHINNRVMFKQLMQLGAIDAAQIDACRLGSINEILSVLLMAAHFNVPIVPHSGGVGMTELCSHLSTLDYVAISGKKSILEYTDHLHEAFVAPAGIIDGYHTSPVVPGYSCDVKEEQFEKYECPNGSFWKTEKGKELMSDTWRGVPKSK